MVDPVSTAGVVILIVIRSVIRRIDIFGETGPVEPVPGAFEKTGIAGGAEHRRRSPFLSRIGRGGLLFGSVFFGVGIVELVFIFRHGFVGRFCVIFLALSVLFFRVLAFVTVRLDRGGGVVIDVGAACGAGDVPHSAADFHCVSGDNGSGCAIGLVGERHDRLCVAVS